MHRVAAAVGALIFVAGATPAAADVVIGPRFSYYFDNSNLRTSSLSAAQVEGPQLDPELNRQLQEIFGTDEIALTTQEEGAGVLADQITFPMIGGMINFGNDRDRFTLTAMYGSGSGRVQQVFTESSQLSIGDIGVNDLTVLRAVGTTDTDKYDVELTWQRRTSEQFAFFAGARYERLESLAEVVASQKATENIEDFLFEAINGEPRPRPGEVLFGNSFDLVSRAVLETFSVRAGVTAFVPFSENVVAFANGMLHASHQPTYSTADAVEDINGNQIALDETEVKGETSLGPDIAVGAQFILSDNLALDVRYRAILFFPVSGDSSFGDARVNHGVNLGVSLRL